MAYRSDPLPLSSKPRAKQAPSVDFAAMRRASLDDAATKIVKSLPISASHAQINAECARVSAATGMSVTDLIDACERAAKTIALVRNDRRAGRINVDALKAVGDIDIEKDSSRRLNDIEACGHEAAHGLLACHFGASPDACSSGYLFQKVQSRLLAVGCRTSMVPQERIVLAAGAAGAMMMGAPPIVAFRSASLNWKGEGSDFALWRRFQVDGQASRISEVAGFKNRSFNIVVEPGEIDRFHADINKARMLLSVHRAAFAGLVRTLKSITRSALVHDDETGDLRLPMNHPLVKRYAVRSHA